MAVKNGVKHRYSLSPVPFNVEGGDMAEKWQIALKQLLLSTATITACYFQTTT
jgi:hypothetical protein